jgi:two-component system sensor histidine kinase UhpB
VRFTLYRLLQELLNNVCKHADASEVAIALFQQGRLRLEVKDNGVGISPTKLPDSVFRACASGSAPWAAS